MTCLHFPNLADIDKIFPDIGDLIPAFTKIFYIPKELYQAICNELYGTFKKIEDLWPPTQFLPPWISTISILDIKNEIFSRFVDPALASLLAAYSTLQQQYILLYKATIGKLIKFIKDFGLQLIDFIKIPPFNISISDLLSGSFDINNLLKKLENMAIEEINAFLALIPNLPEMWVDIKNIAVKIVTAIQSYITNLFKGFIEYIMKLLKPIVDFINTLSFGIFTLITIPEFPTLEQIIEKFNFYINLGLTNIKEIFDNILKSLPGFELIKSLINLPDPLLPNLIWPSFTFTFTIDNLFIKLYNFVFEEIINFILSLPIIGDIINNIISIIKFANWFPKYIISSLCSNKISSDPFPNNKIEIVKI